MSPDQPSDNEPARRPRRRAGGIIAGIVVALVIAGGGGTALYLALRPKPEDAVREFLAAAQARDLTRLKADCTGNSLALLNQFSDAEVQGVLNQALGGSELSYEIAETTTDEAGARVTVHFPKKAGGFDTLPFRVAKEDGKWKVDVVATIMPLMSQLVPLGQQGLGLPSFGGSAPEPPGEPAQPGPTGRPH
jgi:hypothetical protein